MRNRFMLFMLIAFVSLSVRAEEGFIEALRFKDADMRVVLQAITQHAERDGEKVNILLAPSIKGIITVNLEKVKWLTALDAVLKTYDYGYEWVGKNIILVDTLDGLAEKRKKLAEAKVDEPLDTRVFVLSFAKVEEAKDPISKMLSARGKLTFDKRTNALVITDTQSSLERLGSAIQELDTITPQVLIEAKVVETDLDATQNMGINWSISANISGSQRPHTWPFANNSSNKYINSESFGADGTLPTNAFSWGTLNASSLSVALEVLFRDINTKILSMPRVTTLDNNTATINVLTEDPVPKYTYNSESSSWEISGYDWISYGVTLEVTPQINREGFVTLTVKPKISDTVGTREFTSGASASVANIPILSTQTTSTKVMIKDGETLVIGGLLRDKMVDTINKVPLLGDIPVLGYLFKHKSKTKVQKNLLIFVTPSIVTPQVTAKE